MLDIRRIREEYEEVSQLLELRGNSYDLKKINEEKLTRLIYPIGFYKTKAKHLKQLPLVLDDEFNGILPDTVEELIEMADGKSALRDTAREGIVFVAEYVMPGTDVETGKSAKPLEDYQGRLSFKVISNKFILKHDA